VAVLDVRGRVDTATIAPGAEQSTYLSGYDAYLEGHVPGAVFFDWTRDGVDTAQPAPVQVRDTLRWKRDRCGRLRGSVSHSQTDLQPGAQETAAAASHTPLSGRPPLSVLTTAPKEQHPPRHPLQYKQLETDAGVFHAMLEGKGVGSDRPVVVRSMLLLVNLGVWLLFDGGLLHA